MRLIWIKTILFSHENKKAVSSFDHKKLILIENKCKTPYEYLTVIFYHKSFL